MPSTWLHTKIHVYVVSTEFWKGNSRRNFKCDLLQQSHAQRRSYRQIHPPLKNVIYTLGIKSISKLCFSRCMRSTKSVLHTEHGKLTFDFDDPSKVKRSLFFSIFTAQGCKQRKFAFLWSMRSKKNMLLMEHEKLFFIFATHLECFGQLSRTASGPL